TSSSGGSSGIAKGLALSGRFEVRRRVGVGGFGEVWEAYDRARRSRVALKRLHRRDAKALLRFKGEFRALADLAHPNLVRLYELFRAGELWCLAMEYVEGVDLLRYISGTPSGSGSDPFVNQPDTLSGSAFHLSGAAPPAVQLGK